MRAEKEKEVGTRRSWLKMYGPEGAEAMEKLASMTKARGHLLGAERGPAAGGESRAVREVAQAERSVRPRGAASNRPRIKPTSDDLRGVVALPGLGLLADD